MCFALQIGRLGAKAKANATASEAEAEAIEGVAALVAAAAAALGRLPVAVAVKADITEAGGSSSRRREVRSRRDRRNFGIPR
jgi:hypothetical protein